MWLNVIDKKCVKELCIRHINLRHDIPTLLFLLSFPGYAKILQKVRRFRNHTEKHSLERGTLQWSKITDPWIGMACSWVFHSQFQEKMGFFFPLRILLVILKYTVHTCFFSKTTGFQKKAHIWGFQTFSHWF